MKSKFIATLTSLSAFSSCWATVDHGARLSLIHQIHQYEISSETFELPVLMPSFQYSLAKGPWTVHLSFSEGDANDSQIESSAPIRYTLKFEQTNKSAFLDYNFDDLWISTGYMTTDQKQAYWATTDGVRSISGNQLTIESFVVESGVGWYFENSQILSSVGLIYQSIEDEYQLSQTLTNTISNNNIKNDKVSETATLGDLNIRYQYYASLNDTSHWLLGAGVKYSKSLNGSAQITQASRTRLAGNDILTQEDDLFIESESESTSLQLQTGLVFDYGSIDISVDKLRNESWSNAFVEAGITLYY